MEGDPIDIDGDDIAGYRWESEYEKTWEKIQESEQGLLHNELAEFALRAKRRIQLNKKSFKLGMTRHMYIVLDLSEAMNLQDLKPTRHHCALKVLEKFVEEFFDQNPISQLGLIITKNKRAEKIIELCAHSKPFLESLHKLSSVTCAGEPSLQNSMELAAQMLKHLPSHISREVMIIFGNLTTCDPRDIGLTIQELKNLSIRVSIVGLSAELFICKRISSETKGTYEVALDDSHLQEALLVHVSPPLALQTQDSCLMKMGFPTYQENTKPAMCYCHLDTKEPDEGWSTTGYFCPQCQSKYCTLPIECKVCGLTLVSATHLARSYHHLFPIDNYEEVPFADVHERVCYGCQDVLKEKMVSQCPQCSRIFCLECDVFVHSSLHVCPGCSNTPST